MRRREPLISRQYQCGNRPHFVLSSEVVALLHRKQFLGECLLYLSCAGSNIYSLPEVPIFLISSTLCRELHLQIDVVDSWFRSKITRPYLSISNTGICLWFPSVRLFHFIYLVLRVFPFQTNHQNLYAILHGEIIYNFFMTDHKNFMTYLYLS